MSGMGGGMPGMMSGQDMEMLDKATGTPSTGCGSGR